jgi:tellurite resistance protein TehA-like permease
MGAAAISVLAGGQILQLPAAALTDAIRPVIAGLSVLLWAVGTWLIPPLIAAGVWRHLIRRVRLRYEPAWWSVVFPVGMYGVASRTLGTAVHVPWLVTLGEYEAWLAFAAWAALIAGMAATLLTPRPKPADGGLRGARPDESAMPGQRGQAALAKDGTDHP